MKDALKIDKAVVLGAGSWGTALAHHLSGTCGKVVLWGRNAAVLHSIREEHKNPRYLPQEQVSLSVECEGDLTSALTGADLVVFSVPSSAMRSVSRAAAQAIGSTALVVSTAKGLEAGSLSRMTEVLRAEIGGGERLAVLSGPSFALEVMRRLPTAVTVASSSPGTAKAVASSFHGRRFRVYTSQDVVGVEMGGVIKNVIAVAAGVVDGLQLGNNARAALITRGVAEMQRFIVRLGGTARTVAGLSGLGDLLLTATGDLSRNRQVGLRLGRGEALNQILIDLNQVAEAVETAPELLKLAQKNGVNTPIIEQVTGLLAGKNSPREAVELLLSREQKEED